MNRRETIKIMSTISVGLLAIPSVSVLLESCQSGFKPGADKNFSDDEQEMITRLSDAIIPDTDTPGAVKAGVPAYIMLMLQDCYDGSVHETFHHGLSQLDSRCKKKYQSPFLSLAKERQFAAVKDLDKEVLNADSQDKLPTFYRLFKHLTIDGFFTSETGATETLKYLPVPGHYSGCLEYKAGDKQWAT